jgi:small-conductance mechanosensitive channel
MSISTISSNIARTQKEIADLSKKISQETKKESDLMGKIIQVEKTITKSISASSLKSKLTDIQRKQCEIAKIQNKKSELSKKEAEKTARLLKYKQDLSKEEERERKKIADSERRQQKEQLDFQRRLKREIESVSKFAEVLKSKSKSVLQADYDIFISHASEDKEDFVRPLAEALSVAGAKVWYDEFALRVGDSLRRSIDQGLLKSKYGTVVLSSSFFAKNWTQYELDAMVAKEMEGHKMILPIWHKVSKTEVLNFSPNLADKVALNSSLNSIEEIASQLMEVIKN